MSARSVAKIVALAVVYAVLARLGLLMDPVAGFATLVWAPTGLCIAALLLGGPSLWPGVALGAFAANLWTGAPIPIAAGIAIGNTLEALLATWGLRRMRGFRPRFDRLVDAFAFLGIAGFLASSVSATIGTTTLWLGGVVSKRATVETWVAWWLGDLGGALLVAPLLLAWISDAGWLRGTRRWLEAACLFGSIVAVCALVFSGVGESRPVEELRRPHMLFTVLLWAGLRFGIQGTTATTFVIAAIGITATALGQGTFVLGSLHESLVFLQVFLVVLAATSIVLGAVVSDRRRAETERGVLLDRLREALDARETFVSIASHELKTPLHALRLQMDLLERTRTDMGRDLEVLRRQARRLENLVEQLLDVSRIGTGRLHLQLEDVDLEAVTREAVQRFEPEGHRADCELVLRADGPIVGHWDRSRLDQIVTNLLSNACKYGAGRPVEIDVTKAGSLARLAVRDRGIGISIDDQKRLFGRFERLVSERHFGGLGLGLWIVRQIVDALGGDIDVQSRPGEGSTFTVELPVRGGGG